MIAFLLSVGFPPGVRRPDPAALTCSIFFPLLFTVLPFEICLLNFINLSFKQLVGNCQRGLKRIVELLCQCILTDRRHVLVIRQQSLRGSCLEQQTRSGALVW